MKHLILVAMLALVATPAFAGHLTESGPITISGQHYHPIVIENKIIRPTGPGQTAITVTFPYEPGSVVTTDITIRNVVIEPGFTNCVNLSNAWLSNIEDVSCRGTWDNPVQNGVILQGRSIDDRLDGVRVTFAITGVLIVHESEGTKITDSTFVAVINGIFADATGSGFRRPQLVVSGTHIASSRLGILARQRTQVSIHDDLLYRHVWNGNQGRYDAIILDGGTDDVTIRDVQVICRPGPVQNYPGFSNVLAAPIPPLVRGIFQRTCDAG